jgi:hypothetical protein
MTLMWTIYERPRDFPDKFVARPHFIGPGWSTPLSYQKVANSLEGVRAMLPPGLHRMERQRDDDPVIVETWL